MNKLSILLTAILIFFGLKIFAQDEQQDVAEVIDSTHFKYCGIRYAFEESGKSLYVDINYNEETPTQVNIMRQIKINGTNYPVKRIGPRAFYGCRNITCVTIPDNVEIIDSSAFRWCVNLSNIGISSNVKRIGPDCFRNCTNLRNFHFPNNLKVVSSGAFRGSGIMNAVLPEGLVEIGAYAFEGCKALEAVKFPQSLKKIDKEAFANCWSIKVVSLYDKVRSVEKGAFMSCRSLKTVVITKAIDTNIKTVIGAEVFAECKALTTVLCNTSRTKNTKDVIFNEEAFKDCTFTADKVIYGGNPVHDPYMAKRKKGESEFEEETYNASGDKIEEMKEGRNHKNAKKEVGVKVNDKKKK